MNIKSDRIKKCLTNLLRYLISTVIALPLRWPVRTWCRAEASNPWGDQSLSRNCCCGFYPCSIHNEYRSAFLRSIVVLLVCFGLLKLLEGDDKNTGYWSRDPKQ